MILSCEQFMKKKKKKVSRIHHLSTESRKLFLFIFSKLDSQSTELPNKSSTWLMTKFEKNQKKKKQRSWWRRKTDIKSKIHRGTLTYHQSISTMTTYIISRSIVYTKHDFNFFGLLYKDGFSTFVCISFLHISLDFCSFVSYAKKKKKWFLKETFASNRKVTQQIFKDFEDEACTVHIV